MRKTSILQMYVIYYWAGFLMHLFEVNLRNLGIDLNHLPRSPSANHLKFPKPSMQAGNKKPEPHGLRLYFSSGCTAQACRTYDLRIMSKDPESVTHFCTEYSEVFVRRVLQISRPDERWFFLARHTIVVDRYSYSSLFV